MDLILVQPVLVCLAGYSFIEGVWCSWFLLLSPGEHIIHVYCKHLMGCCFMFVFNFWVKHRLHKKQEGLTTRQFRSHMKQDGFTTRTNSFSGRWHNWNERMERHRDLEENTCNAIMIDHKAHTSVQGFLLLCPT